MDHPFPATFGRHDGASLQGRGGRVGGDDRHLLRMARESAEEGDASALLADEHEREVLSREDHRVAVITRM